MLTLAATDRDQRVLVVVRRALQPLPISSIIHYAVATLHYDASSELCGPEDSPAAACAASHSCQPVDQEQSVLFKFADM